MNTQSELDAQTLAMLLLWQTSARALTAASKALRAASVDFDRLLRPGLPNWPMWAEAADLLGQVATDAEDAKGCIFSIADEGHAKGSSKDHGASQAAVDLIDQHVAIRGRRLESMLHPEPGAEQQTVRESDVPHPLYEIQIAFSGSLTKLVSQTHKCTLRFEFIDQALNGRGNAGQTVVSDRICTGFAGTYGPLNLGALKSRIWQAILENCPPLGWIAPHIETIWAVTANETSTATQLYP
jgi:hypothetical protein